MKTITAQLQENLREGKRRMDTMRELTPGVGLYPGVTHEEADELALRFAEFVFAQQDILSALRVAQVGPVKSYVRALGKAAGVAAVVEIGKRKGGLGVLAFLGATYGVGTAAAYARTR